MKWLLFQQFCNKVFKTILKNEREKHNFLLDDVFPEYWFLSNFFKTCVSSNWSRRYGFWTGKVDFWSFQILSFPRTDTDGTVHSRRGNVTFYTSFSNKVRFLELKSMGRFILDEKTIVSRLVQENENVWKLEKLTFPEENHRVEISSRKRKSLKTSKINFSGGKPSCRD